MASTLQCQRENEKSIFTLRSMAVKDSDEDRPEQSIGTQTENEQENSDAYPSEYLTEDGSHMLGEINDLLYWKDKKKTALVLGCLLLILINMAMFSVLNVVVYLSLAVLVVTFSFRLYKPLDLQSLRSYLDRNLAISSDQIDSVVKNFVCHFNCATREALRLFLIEDIVDSLKFGFHLWLMTYIVRWFTGFTLVIFGVIWVFTVPRICYVLKLQEHDDRNTNKNKIGISALVTKEETEKEMKILRTSVHELRKELADLSTHIETTISELKSEYNTKLASLSVIVSDVASQNEVQIAFSAFIQDPLDVDRKQTIVFKEINSNIGGAYSPENGIFTAPIKGTYFFFARIVSAQARACDLCVNGRQVMAIHVFTFYRPYIESTPNAAIVQMNKGDQACVSYKFLQSDAAYLRGLGGQDSRSWCAWSSFSGYLIHADIRTE